MIGMPKVNSVAQNVRICRLVCIIGAGYPRRDEMIGMCRAVGYVFKKPSSPSNSQIFHPPLLLSQVPDNTLITSHIPIAQ